MRFLVAVLTVLLALGNSAVVGAAPKTQRVVLASPLVEEGSGPDGCTPAVSGFGGPAVWEVRVERFLLDGKALVETSREATLDRFPLCIASLPVAKNAEVELSFVTHDGGMARAAGIVLRFVDPQDFYVVEADAVAGHVRLVRVLNGERREIANRPAVLVTGKAQSLRIKATDDDLAVALNGKDLFDVRDGGLALPGRFGIWSRADSLTSFGDLFITILD
ncbi:MAG: hypothetical protein WB760_27855 [Xanthobacteraceae bacterium]